MWGPTPQQVQEDIEGHLVRPDIRCRQAGGREGGPGSGPQRAGYPIILMVIQQELGLTHVLRMLPVSQATLLPGASCQGSRPTWCSSCPTLSPTTAPTRKWEDSCLTSTSASTIQAEEREKELLTIINPVAACVPVSFHTYNYGVPIQYLLHPPQEEASQKLQVRRLQLHYHH